jgi:hypothetical protein
MKFLTSLRNQKDTLAILGLLTLSLILTSPQIADATGQFTLGSPSQASTLVFSSSGIEPGTCVASGGYGSTWTGVKAENSTYNFSFPGGTFPVGIHTFTITCDSTVGSTQGGASVTDSTILTVLPSDTVQLAFSSSSAPNPLDPLGGVPPVLNFEANNYYIYYNGSVRLTWSYTDPNGSCVAEGSWVGTRGISGTVSYNNKYRGGGIQSKTYTLKCYTNNVLRAQASIPVDFESYENMQ